MRIYTGTGDAGETGLFGGERVSKNDLRVEAYGTVDETSAVLGVAATYLDGALHDIVVDLQRQLFTVGSDLATPLIREVRAKRALVPRIQASQTEWLEKVIDSYEETLTPLQQFIVPGGTRGSAYLHQARAVARRAERDVVALYRLAPDTMNGELLKYMNRLTDLLFVLARAANNEAGVADIPWSRPEPE